MLPSPIRVACFVAAAAVCLPGLPADGQILTDSARDFSNVQGGAGWSYGFSADPFAPSAFQLLELYTTNVSAQIGWMHSTNQPPWTRITTTQMHPDTDATPAEWADRRWTSSVNGRVRISGSLAKAVSNANASQDGITGVITVNGAPAFTRSVARNDTFGYEFAIEVPVTVGTPIEFAVSANGNNLVDATVFTATIAVAEPPANWTAFNDHYAGGRTHPNATAWNVFTNAASAPGQAGALKNIATGAVLPATLTITNYHATGGFTSDGPDSATPGYSLFHGVIDFGTATSGTNHAILTAASNSALVAFVFTGLSPTNEYRFRGLSVRGDALYTNRWSLCEITNALSFAPASTTGVLTHAQVPALTAAQAALNSGDNTVGNVVGWDRIQPGTNGSFTVLCRQYTGAVPGGTTAGAPHAYAFSAVRLSEYPPARAPQINGVVREGALLKFDFATEADRLYSVEYQPDLPAGSWQTLTNIAGTGTPVTVSANLTGPRRFFRVRVQ